VTELFR